MPRDVTIISVFLASPSDVTHERQVCADAIDEWNLRRGRYDGVMYELLQWETTVSAGFSSDGQEVINQQIGSYDLLISILWTRIGTKTPRAPSGTIEEYHRALARYKDGEPVELAFFFKDAPVNLKEIDFDQAAGVAEFQSSVQEAGALSKSFKDDEGLKFEISILLDRLSKVFSAENLSLTRSKLAADSAAKTISDPEDNDDLEDVGLFDAVAALDQHASAAATFVSNLTENLVQQSAVIDKAVSEMSAITQTRPLSLEEAKPFIEELSAEMDNFSSFLERDLPLYEENLIAMANDVRTMVRISYDWIDTADNMLESLLPFEAMLKQMHVGMTVSEQGVEGFLSAVSGMQRTTSAFNKSRRRLLNAGSILVTTSGKGRALISQAVDEISALILHVRAKDHKRDSN